MLELENWATSTAVFLLVIMSLHLVSIFSMHAILPTLLYFSLHLFWIPQQQWIPACPAFLHYHVLWLQTLGPVWSATSCCPPRSARPTTHHRSTIVNQTVFVCVPVNEERTHRDKSPDVGNLSVERRSHEKEAGSPGSPKHFYNGTVDLTGREFVSWKSFQVNCIIMRIQPFIQHSGLISKWGE